MSGDSGKYKPVAFRAYDVAALDVLRRGDEEDPCPSNTAYLTLLRCVTWPPNADGDREHVKNVRSLDRLLSKGSLIELDHPTPIGMEMDPTTGKLTPKTAPRDRRRMWQGGVVLMLRTEERAAFLRDLWEKDRGGQAFVKVSGRMNPPVTAEEKELVWEVLADIGTCDAPLALKKYIEGLPTGTRVIWDQSNPPEWFKELDPETRTAPATAGVNL